MVRYTCKMCYAEEDTGFGGGTKRIYITPVCNRCLKKWNKEEAKPIIEQSEDHLKEKLGLVNAVNEMEYKQSTSAGEAMFGSPATRNIHQTRISKYQGDVQMIQTELQRRASAKTATTIIKEHVRLHCRYCGDLHDITDLKCPSCGASTK